MRDAVKILHNRYIKDDPERLASLEQERISDEVERAEDSKKIDEIIAKGHPHHCACRQVWGDGECECDLYKQGYDPYAWLKA